GTDVADDMIVQREAPVRLDLEAPAAQVRNLLHRVDFGMQLFLSERSEICALRTCRRIDFADAAFTAASRWRNIGRWRRIRGRIIELDLTACCGTTGRRLPSRRTTTSTTCRRFGFWFLRVRRAFDSGERQRERCDAHQPRQPTSHRYPF